MTWFLASVFDTFEHSVPISMSVFLSVAWIDAGLHAEPSAKGPAGRPGFEPGTTGVAPRGRQCMRRYLGTHAHPITYQGRFRPLDHRLRQHGRPRGPVPKWIAVLMSRNRPPRGDSGALAPPARPLPGRVPAGKCIRTTGGRRGCSIPRASRTYPLASLIGGPGLFHVEQSGAAVRHWLPGTQRLQRTAAVRRPSFLCSSGPPSQTGVSRRPELEAKPDNARPVSTLGQVAPCLVPIPPAGPLSMRSVALPHALLSGLQYHILSPEAGCCVLLGNL